MLEEVFEEFAGVGDAVGAVAEGLAGPYALEKLAPGGAVPLLEAGHDGFHVCSSGVAVAPCKAKDHAGADKGAAGALHVAHTCAVGSGNLHGGVFAKAHKVAVGADYGLGAVVGIAALLFGRKVLS